MRCSPHIPSVLALAAVGALACTMPSKIEVTPEDVVLEKAGKSVLLRPKVLDQDGKEMSTRGLDINWYCEDTSVVRLTQDGVVTAVASGEADVRVEVAETDVKTTVTVEVKIPAAVHVSIDKTRLWEGQTKEDIWAAVKTEKGAFVPGIQPSWSSENPNIVKVEAVNDPNRPQSFVKLTGVSPGATRVTARYENLVQDVRVNVFAEGEEVQMVGTGISEKKARDARRGKKKKEKALKYDF